MYKYHIKRIFILIILLATYYPKPVLAMEQGSTLTEIAEEKERNEGKFISPQGVVYKRKKKIKNRVEHIKKHLTDDTSKRRHTFFNEGTDVHNDIIGFVDVIFEQFSANNIDPASQNKAKNIVAGVITLHNKQYKVIDNFDGVQHTYDIIRTDISDSSYPPLGTYGGSLGDKSQLFGYRLSLTYTTAGPEIETLCLSELNI